MEWVIRERPYRLGELEYSYLLECTVKLHGVSQGEKLFTRVPQEFQNELLYNNFVIACLDQGVIRLALEYMKKMRELGYRTSHLVYNRLIIRNSIPGRGKLIAKDLALMKADKATPHVSTYHILMKLEANEHNIDGVIKVFEGMKKAGVEPNEVSYCILAMAHAVARLYTVAEAYTEEIEKSITGDNWSTLDILMILYGRLGKEKELKRTWDVVRGLHHVRSKITCWQQKRLRESGLIEKAIDVLREMTENDFKPNSITYRHLALGCAKAKLMKEALKNIEMGSNLKTSKNVSSSTPWLETTRTIIECLALKGDVENSEKLFEEVKNAKYNRYAFVYNALFKAYVKAKVYNLFKRMVLAVARPDAETYSLLKLVEQYKPS